MGIESPLHLLFLGAVALIVLGPKRLPELARALGKGIREFRGAFDEAAAPQTVAAPMLEREQPTEQLAVAPMTTQAGAPPAPAQHVAEPPAGTPQGGTQRAAAPQTWPPQGGTEHAGPVVQGRPAAGPESPR